MYDFGFEPRESFSGSFFLYSKYICGKKYFINHKSLLFTKKFIPLKYVSNY